MPRETYSAARIRLHDELARAGWATSSPSLKVLWAQVPGTNHKIWFKAQAVYLDEHSLWTDIRGMSVQELIADVQRTLTIRSRSRY